ncbi:MAG: hypothetical protein ACR2LN_01160 [Candidatus Levyibacteriota bacterium]
MLGSHATHISQHDREEHANQLSLSLVEFNKLLDSANRAYEVIKELGPFYGREEIEEPTFRVTAKPVLLPKGSEKLLIQFGNDLVHLARALKELPASQKKLLGENIDFSIPGTWRIDAILLEKGHIKVNEVEGVDSANALMIAEQQAYHLQSLRESTAAKLIPTLKAMCVPQNKDYYKIALLRNITPFSPHTVNATRFIKFLDILSKGTLEVEMLDSTAIRDGSLTPNWKKYAGVINEQDFSVGELLKLGLIKTQILSSGNYNAIGNKGVFALLFDETLESFWITKLGKVRLERLKKILLPSSFITSISELEKARNEGKVVKVSWAGSETALINRSRGVAMPNDLDEHGTNERWELLKTLLQQGVKIIAQDFVMPSKIRALLRKKGTNLEPVEWYNRICVKYVAEGDPNAYAVPSVVLTATEVTLGPDIIPAGRKCAFTAGRLR